MEGNSQILQNIGAGSEGWEDLGHRESSMGRTRGWTSWNSVSSPGRDSCQVALATGSAREMPDKEGCFLKNPLMLTWRIRAVLRIFILPDKDTICE